MSIADHGWRGRGRIRAARYHGTFVLRLWRVGTRAGKLKQEIAAFFRSDYHGQRPSAGPMRVRIWIVGEAQGGRQPRFDVDNVAKACLDALTGAVWLDDSQVQCLSVVKLPPGQGREANALYLAIDKLGGDPADRAAELGALLSAIDGAPQNG